MRRINVSFRARLKDLNLFIMINPHIKYAIIFKISLFLLTIERDTEFDDLRLKSSVLNKFFKSEKINKSMHKFESTKNNKSISDLTRKRRLKRLNYNSNIPLKMYRIDCLGKDQQMVTKKSDCVYLFSFKVILLYFYIGYTDLNCFYWM